MNAIRSSLFRCGVSAALLLSLACGNTAIAQDDRDEDDSPIPFLATGKRPFVVVSASSANQLKEKAAYMFEAAGNPEALDTVLSLLDENVNGLSGLDWDRPAGMMCFLDSVLPPAFEFVAFLPMSSVSEFQSMMELGPVVMRQDTSEEGRYELISPNRNIQIRTQGNYAFIQMPFMDPDPTFDRDLPAPGSVATGITSQFDLGITLDVDAIPKATRDLLFNMLSSTMSTQAQQRDEEPDEVYAVRDAWQQRDIAALKLFFEDTQRMSFGLRVNPDRGTANIDMIVNARDASDMLEEIFLAATKPSYFTPLISELAPISVSYSNVFAERDRKAGSEAIEAVKGWLALKIEEEELGATPTEGSPLFIALSALSKTIEEGHLDMFSQIYRDSTDKVCVVGAVRIEDGDAVGSGLEDLLIRFRDMKDIGEIEVGHRQHQEINFHRVLFRDPDAGANELFGPNPGVLVGCSGRSMWFCVGGENSYDVLTGVVDELKTAYENPAERVSPAPMSVVVHLHDLVNLVQGAEAANREERAKETASVELDEKPNPTGGQSTSDGQSDRAKRRQEFIQRRREMREKRNAIFMEALADGEDMIHVEFRPTDSGMRMRANFDVGFIRGVGRMIASQVTGE